MLQQILSAIEQKHRFVLVSHARPDGDAVGSVLALYQVLLQRGKQAVAILSDPVPLLYKSLPFADCIQQGLSVEAESEETNVLQCAPFQRTRISGLERFFAINIDHHSSGKPFAQINWIDPTACAVGAMVYRLALASGAKITPQI